MEKYYKQYDRCRQNEKPFCTNACPFHMDMLDFQSKIIKNNYNAAYKTLRNAVGFPDIVAALCAEYCASACPRKDLDESVRINLLEKTCVAKATKKDPTDYNVPIKNRKIAIIGAGISGLACALRLTQKKYDVTIYEKSGRWGGVLWDLLPAELFLEDIRRQLQFETYDLQYNTEIKEIEAIKDQGFEAVYAATGKGGNDFGVMNQEQGHCFIKDDMAVFAGGGLTGKEPVRALADGLDMAWSIEVFLKTGRLEYPKEAENCRAVADQDRLIRSEAVIPTDGGIYTDSEAAAEAGRCIRCQCNACMKYCDVCDYHNKWPMRIRDDIMGTVAFSTSESMLKKTPAKRMMNTCTQCGLCDEVCPEGIEIGGMLLEARRSLHKQGTMPGAYHQFWIRDMEFANSDRSALVKKGAGMENGLKEANQQEGQQDENFAFFPGCQLGASDPRYVMEAYRWLLRKKPDTGMLLRCCGIPAEWAGNEGLHDIEIANLKKDWEQLGQPVLILACPSCQKHLKEYLPQIETISLYEVLDQWDNDHKKDQGEKQRDENQGVKDRVEPESTIVYSVFDPCSARHVKPMEQAVRNLAKMTGIKTEEFPKGDLHGCCGYGGHVSEANADYAAYVVKSRCEMSDRPYLTYCINCRDIFRGEGKRAIHILDLVFDINRNDCILPNLSDRRRNRVDLKNILLKEIWGEVMDKQSDQLMCKLKINEDVQEKMNRMKILDEDLCEVIEFGERTKRRTYDPETRTYTCYRELGHITYWVEYQKTDDGYEVISAYTHRMKIKLEGVWNGRKTEADL